jgi:hypothetical protein
MVTKVVNTGDSSGGLFALIIVLVIIAAGFIAYQQGMFGNKSTVEINLPGGKEITGSVTK